MFKKTRYPTHIELVKKVGSLDETVELEFNNQSFELGIPLIIGESKNITKEDKAGAKLISKMSESFDLYIQGRQSSTKV